MLNIGICGESKFAPIENSRMADWSYQMEFLQILAPKSLSDIILLFVFLGGILYLGWQILSNYFSLSISVSRKASLRRREVTPRVVVTAHQREAVCRHEKVVPIEVPDEGADWSSVVDIDYKCLHCKKQSTKPFGTVVRN
jgi:hypothetical protein